MPFSDPATACLPPKEALAAWPGRDYPLSPAVGQRVFIEPPCPRTDEKAPLDRVGRTATFGSEEEATVLSALVTQLRRDWPSADAAAWDDLQSLLASLPAQDLVVMARRPGQAAHQARAVYLEVENPSGWCPACALGKGFAALHGPVPAIGPFRTGPQRRAFAVALFPHQPRVRFVWSVKPTRALNRAACHRCPHPTPSGDWRAAQTPVLRVERQVVLPVDAQFSAFLIRVAETPFDRLALPYRRALTEALASLPAGLAAYKGIDVPQALACLTHSASPR